LSKLQIVIVLLLIAAAVFAPLLQSPDLDKQLVILKAIIREVPPPPDTQLMSADDRPKFRSIFLNRDFQSKLKFDEIGQYYSEQLIKRGWQLARDRKLNYYGRDLGGRQLVFCKDPYELTLSYTGQRDTSPLNYEYSMLWNQKNACPN
jgi:hypothetical protein